MKYAKYGILIVICMILILSCRSKQVQYQFCQEADQIQSIQIAEGISEMDAGQGNYEKIKVIVSIPQEKWNIFLDDFTKVQCFRFRNDPCQSLEGVIIYVTYKNGAIELVGKSAAFYHWIGNTKRGKFRPYYFDMQQFEELISKYSEG